MDQQSLQSPYRIAVDVGGTFTDLVLADARGRLVVAKVPSVPADPGRGVIAAVDDVAAQLGMERRALLSDSGLFIHGSTVATNTMIEAKGARVGLLTTVGFRDSLEIRRGIRTNQWDHRRPFPPVLVPRYLRLAVRERTGSEGEVVTPLSTDDVIAAVRHFQREGVESIAIAFINSFLNDRHERECEALVREVWDGDWVSVSSSIVPVIGEYERTSTTVVNAYLAPRVVPYLVGLNDVLKAHGLANSMLLLQSNGGAVSVEQVAERPVNLVLSGPAAGVGALRYFARPAQTESLISMEIGGTSCDVMLMSNGEVGVTDSLDVEEYHLSVPAIDIHTVGAGGGTLAGVDGAGMLYVGPRGAGANPGPACYGRGGEQPTVTDAQVVLGKMGGDDDGEDPGKTLSLDRGLALDALLDRVATPLGIDAELAANGITRLLEQNLLHAVERISIERGYDPSRFVLVAAGGAGPMFGASVGRLLGCRQVYVPRLAGVFCALGMLHSDVRQEFFRVVFGNLMSTDVSDLEQAYADLSEQATTWLATEGFDAERSVLVREINLRYRAQQWSIRVTIPAVTGPEVLSQDARSRDEGQRVIDHDLIRKAFEQEHQRLFGHIQPDGNIELTAVRVIAVGKLDVLEHPNIAATERLAAAASKRDLITRDGRTVAADVYHGSTLAPGMSLLGPALIEEATTTIYVGPDDRLRVDEANNYVIELEKSA